MTQQELVVQRLMTGCDGVPPGPTAMARRRAFARLWVFWNGWPAKMRWRF